MHRRQGFAWKFLHRRVRNNRGDMLIEALIASVLAGFVMTATMQTLSTVRKMGTQSRNQIIMAAISTEVIDELRVLPYSMVANSAGNYAPVVIGTSPVAAPTGTLFPRPLLQDFATLDYSGNGSPIVPSNSAQQSSNVFHTYDPKTHAPTDTLQVNIAPSATANALVVTITGCYLDGNGFRTWTTQSLITPNGLNG